MFGDSLFYSSLSPILSPVYGKKWEKGAQIAAILEWRDSYGQRLAGTCPLSRWERAK